MKRREFCRQLSALGATVIGAPLLQACQSVAPAPSPDEPLVVPQPTATTAHPTMPADTAVPPASAVPSAEPEEAQPAPSLQPTAETDVAHVALVKTTDRASGVLRAIQLLAINPARALPVLLKPNLNSADAAPASTHPDVLRSLVLALQDMGARTITIGERSGMGETRPVMQELGVLDMADELGLATAVFDELSETDWVVRQSGDFHWPDGFAVPRMLLDAACVVQTCNLKTHRFGGHFTLSLKNSVGFAARTVGSGGTNYMQQLHNSDYQRQMIAEINAIYTPGLVVIDGVEAFVSGGPDRGALVQPEVVLAGTDRVALDAVGVAILRLFGTTPAVSQGSIFAQEQIARAVELGLGVDSPSKIRFVTADAESQAYAQRISAIL